MLGRFLFGIRFGRRFIPKFGFEGSHKSLGHPICTCVVAGVGGMMISKFLDKCLAFCGRELRPLPEINVSEYANLQKSLRGYCIGLRAVLLMIITTACHFELTSTAATEQRNSSQRVSEVDVD